MLNNTALELPVEHFAHLITLYQRELKRLIVRKLGSVEAAEDILQDAYLRLTHYQTLNAIENPRAFVFRIVSNLVIDYQRLAVNRMPHDSAEEVLHAIPDQAVEPEQHCLAEQRLRIIRKALEDLPPNCRQIFYLNRVAGYSHAEIAATLHLSESMVAKHLLKAMTYCREQLKNS